nr:MAG TPA: endonuclease I [Caudoviricetes sp.]
MVIELNGLIKIIKKRVSKKIRDTQNRPDKKLHMSKLSSNALLDGTIGSVKCIVNYLGRELYLRSSYELKVFTYLNDLDISFKYEDTRYEYDFDGFRLYHVVDFYIPKYNLIIEVKPSYKFKDGFIKNHNEEYRKIIAKRDGGIALGYNSIFITEDNLDSKDSFYKAISKYV